jgi:hypothetical protein
MSPPHGCVIPVSRCPRFELNFVHSVSFLKLHAYPFVGVLRGLRGVCGAGEAGRRPPSRAAFTGRRWTLAPWAVCGPSSPVCTAWAAHWFVGRCRVVWQQCRACVHSHKPVCWATGPAPQRQPRACAPPPPSPPPPTPSSHPHGSTSVGSAYVFGVYDKGLGLQEVAAVGSATVTAVAPAAAGAASGGASGEPSGAGDGAYIMCVRVSADCSRFAAGLGSGEIKVYVLAATLRAATGAVVYSTAFHVVGWRPLLAPLTPTPPPPPTPPGSIPAQGTRCSRKGCRGCTCVVCGARVRCDPAVTPVHRHVPTSPHPTPPPCESPPPSPPCTGTRRPPGCSRVTQVGVWVNPALQRTKLVGSLGCPPCSRQPRSCSASPAPSVSWVRTPALCRCVWRGLRVCGRGGTSVGARGPRPLCRLLRSSHQRPCCLRPVASLLRRGFVSGLVQCPVRKGCLNVFSCSASVRCCCIAVLRNPAAGHT